MVYELVVAGPDDGRAIAALHADSWRDAYKGLVPDAFLAGPVVQNRRELWDARMAHQDANGRLVLKAVAGGALIGFTCVVRDADPAWGPLLDNLHVTPRFRGSGVGTALFRASREWAARAAPGRPMHLWVIEDNVDARRFYDRQGGRCVERRVVELTAGIRVPALRYIFT